jgi:F-type H+-transporting ATPase subunit epsilon
MVNEFSVLIQAPDKILFQGKVISLIVPAQNGYMGILAHHIPLISNTITGNITIKTARGETTNLILTQKGILEVSNNNVTLLLYA